MSIHVLVAAHLVLSAGLLWTFWFLATGGPETLIFLFIWPVVVAALISYFIVGALLLRAAFKKSPAPSKNHRVLLGALGVIPIALLAVMLCMFCTALITNSNLAQKQKTILAKQEAHELIKTCKIQATERKNEGDKTTASLQLDKNQLNFFEKQFSANVDIKLPVDPNIYDQLLHTVRSAEVRGKCGYIATNYSQDPTYLKLPSELKAITSAELDTLIRSCAIDELHQGTMPPEIGSLDPTKGIPMYKVQEPTGPYTHIYTEDIPYDERETLFADALTKQAECNPRRPIIVMP